MVLIFSIFAVLGLSIYFGAHYFLYLSFIRFFSIANPATKNIVFYSILFLSFIFIFSSLLSHLKENFLTKSFYFLSGFWLGLMANLAISAAAVWLVILISKSAGFFPNAVILSVLFFSAAFLYSIYGSWNAFNPRIKNVTINIKNLPPEWRGKNVVQISDAHLGHIYGADFLENVVRQINALYPSAVFITGDLFDGMDGDMAALAQPLNKVKAEKGIYFVTGNHETYLGVDKTFAVLAKTKIKILKNEVADLDGLKIIGINYPERGESSDEISLLQSLRDKYFGAPNILLFHSPVNIDQVKENGVNVQLAGHTHKGQIFPLNFVTAMVYKGYDYGLHTLGDFSIYTTTGVGTWGPPLRTGNTPEIVNITLE